MVAEYVVDSDAEDCRPAETFRSAVARGGDGGVVRVVAHRTVE
jgi:hypothetical protein